MKKVITYGTFDLLHYGHVRLLQRAKKLGDYFIIGVTSDDFDKSRGKINVQQSLLERMEAIRALGIADEIIIEEYEGQKIDDIRRKNIDIFTVGSDWVGKFDYLSEFCTVIYLDRTEGISSSEIRGKNYLLSLGLVGNSSFLNKFEKESHFVNGITLGGLCTEHLEKMSDELKAAPLITRDYPELLCHVDAVYIYSKPELHYEQIKLAINQHKHVLCESPMTLNRSQTLELFNLAQINGCILQESIRTAYSLAYSRMLLLLKSGVIGRVVSVDATCTSLSTAANTDGWNSIYSWGPTALLPIFQILGICYDNKKIITSCMGENPKQDAFTKIDFVFPHAVASVKVGKGMKSEGELIISGTKGYIYVPAPWWKTDYFEIRYENPAENKRYFYQLDGEGIRYEMVAFAQAIRNQKCLDYILKDVSCAISHVMQDYTLGKDVTYIDISPESDYAATGCLFVNEL